MPTDYRALFTAQYSRFTLHPCGALFVCSSAVATNSVAVKRGIRIPPSAVSCVTRSKKNSSLKAEHSSNELAPRSNIPYRHSLTLIFQLCKSTLAVLFLFGVIFTLIGFSAFPSISQGKQIQPLKETTFQPTYRLSFRAAQVSLRYLPQILSQNHLQ